MHDTQKQRAQCPAKPIDQPDCITERGDVHVHGAHHHSIETVSSKQDAPLDPTFRRVKWVAEIKNKLAHDKQQKQKKEKTPGNLKTQLKHQLRTTEPPQEKSNQVTHPFCSLQRATGPGRGPSSRPSYEGIHS
ncbi:hypothetical protein JTE90_021132 [Oedothorax gibbosus]|uniref:Uncharacterized protein n=1 Tax=Oedothorax gibbosus TaxID=931172 RepID=A0AAV6U1E3_9ARAC|nr:hypothetical protein JTE90_021132 [Oedothorax gibbosus]